MSNSRAKTALDQLNKGNILVKMIPSEIGIDGSWRFTMKQLLDPKNNRPYKVSRLGTNRSQIWDAKKQTWEYRKPHKNRGHKKDTIYIKPTAMTYPPQNGKMLYFYSTEIENYIGIGCRIFNETDPEKIKHYINLSFDQLNKSHPNFALIYIKDKYIFKTNIKSNLKPWLYNPKDHKYEEKNCDLISTTLTNIHDDFEKLSSDETPRWNEVHCSPSLQSLTFLFSDNILLDRLNLLAKYNLLKTTYCIDLPLLIMDENTVAKEYELSQQLDDLDELIKIYTNSQDPFLLKKCSVLLKSIDLKNILTYLDPRRNQSATVNNCLDDKVCRLLSALYQFNDKQKFNEFFESLPITLNSQELNVCLHAAITKNDLAHIKKFLVRGADPNNKVKDISALSLSIKLANKNIFDCLIDYKLDIKTLQDALLRVSTHRQFGFAVYVAKKLFLKKSFNPDAITFESFTALHHAVSKRNIDLVKLICINGGNAGLIQGQATSRSTPIDKALELAKTDGNYQIVESLITHAIKTLTPKARGFCIKTLICRNLPHIAKLIINANESIELPEYEMELTKILTMIANLNVNKQSKQTYALLFITKLFNETDEPNTIMLNFRILIKSPPEVKNFLFASSFTNHNWNNEPVGSFFSQIIKLAKLRILHLIKENDHVLITREIEDFLKTPRKSGLISFFQPPTSLQILEECNTDKWRCMLKAEDEQTNTMIRRSYGLGRLKTN